MSSVVVELQSLAPAPGGGEWRPGSLVVSRRTKWIIQKIIRIQDNGRVIVYLTRPKGQKIHLAVFIETQRGWVMGSPTKIPF
ncbi:MAG: hypothetical protein AB1522_13540 [Chloroflexota bacterium]